LRALLCAQAKRKKKRPPMRVPTLQALYFAELEKQRQAKNPPAAPKTFEELARNKPSLIKKTKKELKEEERKAKEAEEAEARAWIPRNRFDEVRSYFFDEYRDFKELLALCRTNHPPVLHDKMKKNSKGCVCGHYLEGGPACRALAALIKRAVAGAKIQAKEKQRKSTRKRKRKKAADR
jgi:hypothetical protein